uniref:Uncharacterized protein n=1 Tax=Daphnia magna TaxID=35525 RepID=A0A0P6CMR3_9CRUS
MRPLISLRFARSFSNSHQSTFSSVNVHGDHHHQHHHIIIIIVNFIDRHRHRHKDIYIFCVCMNAPLSTDSFDRTADGASTHRWQVCRTLSHRSHVERSVPTDASPDRRHATALKKGREQVRPYQRDRSRRTQ